ncbi:MAG: DUF4422 domain-containing protein [Chitinophagaceae bacterium]|nr:MAG: DUF4422 domain-containing protein [Chitinophagaceae bacterium]
MNVKIFVVTHKAQPPVSNEVYVPIQVGSRDDISPGILRDASGDSIPLKNASFCELTASYWVWKNNADADIVGLCHYRRWFNLFPPITSLTPSRQKKVTLSQFGSTSVAKASAQKTTDKVISLLKNHDIILLRAYHVSEGLSAAYYNDEGHRKPDWDETLKIIRELFPEYDQSIRDFLDAPGNFHIGNMMITTKKIWDDYYHWLFAILFELEKRIEVPLDPVQGRVFGYISERILNLYVYHNKLRIKNLGGYKITDI